MKEGLRQLLIILLSVYLLGCAASSPAPVSELNRDYDSLSRGSYRGSYYTVNKGDTLYFIAYITDKDVNDLIRYNHLSPPYTIYQGQKLNLWHSVYSPPAYGRPQTTRVARATSPVAVTSAAPALKAIPKVKVFPDKLSVKPKMSTTSKPEIRVKKNSNEPTNVSFKNAKNAQNADKLKNKHAEVSKKPVKSVERSQAKRYGESEGKENVNNKLIKTDSNHTKISKWIWPTRGRVIRNFSVVDQGNKGIDIAGRRGQSVVSSASGKVVYSGNALRGYGNLVIIKHNDNYLSAYAHNDQLLVREGQNVKAGQKIATMGSSGTNRVQLHFEIRYQGKPVNPKRYLP